MSNTIMYGIPNCDTIKKAKKWLANNNHSFDFHDYRKDGISKEWIYEAESEIGWEKMLNKRGTTFRQLTDEQKSNIDRESALSLLESHPAMIKRPILLHNGQFTVGFSPDLYDGIFA